MCFCENKIKNVYTTVYTTVHCTKYIAKYTAASITVKHNAMHEPFIVSIWTLNQGRQYMTSHPAVLPKVTMKTNTGSTIKPRRSVNRHIRAFRIVLFIGSSNSHLRYRKFTAQSNKSKGADYICIYEQNRNQKLKNIIKLYGLVS